MAMITNADIARRILRDAVTTKELVYILDIHSFAKYDEARNYYKIMSKEEMNHYVLNYILSINLQRNITSSLFKDVIILLETLIPKVNRNVMTPYIAINDGVINLDTGKVEEVNRDNYVFFYIDTTKEKIEKGYSKDDLWIKFIEDVIVDKNGKTHQPTIDVLQEMFGYYMLNDLGGQVTFFLNGKGANGKSVILSVLKHITGKDFYTALTVEHLTMDQFASSTLIGKKLNICDEDESQFTRSDRFKAMVSGNEITVRRMYKEGFMWKPTVKHLFATNKMPTFTGLGEALLRRIRIIPFNKVVPVEKRIPFLENKICRNVAPIIAWALEGAQRLKKNNYKFTHSELIEAKSEEFKSSLSAAIMFIEERYNYENETERIDIDNLYEDYKIWCSQRGKKAQNYYNFRKDIEDNLKIKYDEDENNGKIYYYLKSKYGGYEPEQINF